MSKLYWPLKWRYRAIDLILEGLAPWQFRAIVTIESGRTLPRVTLWKWTRADIQEDETCTTQ